MEKIIIIGGAAAGMTFASKLNRAKTNIEHVIYERRSYTSLGACGIPFVIGGHAPNGAQDLLDPTYQQQIDKGINVKIKHEVLSIDFQNKVVQVKNLETQEVFSDSYTKLFIATGARPRQLNIDGSNLKNIHYGTSFEDANQWVDTMSNSAIKNVVIVGSGFIGMEMAESFKTMGKKVTIIEVVNRPVANIFDKEITDHMETLFQENDIEFRNNEMVQSFLGKDKVEKVVTNKGEYEADAVLISIGYIPNTEIFKQNLELHKNGSIVIDKKGQTSIKDVYAAGDCVSITNPILEEQVYVPLATTSRRMATIIFDNLIENKNIEYKGSIGSSGFRFFDKEFFAVGINEARAQSKDIKYFSSYIKDFDSSFYSGVSKELHLKLIANEEGVLIGAQSFGENKSAAMRIAMLSAAIFKKTTVAELQQMDLFYTPPFSRATDITAIAARVVSKKINK